MTKLEQDDEVTRLDAEIAALDTEISELDAEIARLDAILLSGYGPGSGHRDGSRSLIPAS